MFEVGWLVVRIQWYDLVDDSSSVRGAAFVLLPEKLWIAVAPLLRLRGLKFAAGPGGPACRSLRSDITSLNYLSSDIHNTITNSLGKHT